ncbi:unnamed protein product [Gongylonema pulchrum]|uniref:Uncharacterized protein n=1 Tax=Gongylonema pulchrum TaxID=637853 RepID=A0A183D419_9BILA|nr:unnamed protein product [Gongylonema pulchrum]
MLQMKRVVREQQFQELAESTAKERPKTANAARSAMSGLSSRKQSTLDHELLEARRALAAKLKIKVEAE